MLYLVPLLAAAALVSLPTASGARISNTLDNALEPQAAPRHRKHSLRKLFLKIQAAPPETVPLIPGQVLKLECEFFASPGPAVSWLKNGEPFVDYEEEANEVLSMHPTSVVHVVSRLLVGDAVEGDVYTCVASGVKQESASTTVVSDDGESTDSLLAKLLVPPKPVITFYYSAVLQDQNTNIILPCRAAGNTQLYWQDRHKNILYDNSRMKILPSGDLLIQGLRWSDMGEFTCVVENDFGKDTATTFLYPLKPSNT